MKKIIVIVGSARKKYTYKAAEYFLHKLSEFEDIESEIIHLTKYKLLPCIGCKMCMDKGEELCPLQDDRC